MSETTYSIENAKTGRSGCKKCKEKIAKGEVRLGVSAPGPGDYSIQSWYHPKCWNLPRKLAKEGIDAATFVEDMLEDNTEDMILGSQADEIASQIAAKAPPKKKAEAEAEASGASKSVQKIKSTLKKMREDAVKEEDDDDFGEGPKKKRAKKEKGSPGTTDDDMAKAEVLAVYEGYKNDELKDVLRWNRQMVSGNKDTMLGRIIDGHMHGRLSRCPSCKRGKVKLTDDGSGVMCRGYFDEDAQVPVSCYYRGTIADAPRLLPWYTREPTEEEAEEMDAQDEAAKTGIVGGDQAEGVKASTKELTELAGGIDWDLSNKDGVKRATKAMLKICREKLALPEDEKKAKMTIGKIIVANKGQSANEVLSEIISQVGFKEVKAAAKKRQHEAHESLCKNSANVPLLEAFMEMAELSAKEGDRFKSSAYRKVTEVIKDIEFEINEDNALGLGKGKTKVAGVGKASAEKMYEFATTGKIEKLEEMKAAAM